jgi:hypothetical protein
MAAKKKRRVVRKSVRRAVRKPAELMLSDLLIIKDAIKKCGGYVRFKATVDSYGKLFASKGTK